MLRLLAMAALSYWVDAPWWIYAAIGLAAIEDAANWVARKIKEHSS